MRKFRNSAAAADATAPLIKTPNRSNSDRYTSVNRIRSNALETNGRPDSNRYRFALSFHGVVWLRTCSRGRPSEGESDAWHRL
jgi:hypothetical protein